VRSALPAPKIRAPKFRPPAPPPQPTIQAAAAPPPSIEPPRIEAPPTPPPPPTAGPVPQAAPPAPVKPKIAFESVGEAARPVANPQIPIPKLSVNDAVHSVIVPGGNTAVEDSSDQFRKTQMQLLSDPKGVDFKPYLVQVWRAVRRNWLAVIPESARLGRQGVVLVQFIIDRSGTVPKLVIAEESGTSAFDRAAVAGIQEALPFPPLPAEYKGDQIRLQLAFSYNVAAR
jgi:TonB family protein